MLEIKFTYLNDVTLERIHNALKGNKAYINNDILLSSDGNTKSIILAGHKDDSEDTKNDITVVVGPPLIEFSSKGDKS